MDVKEIKALGLNEGDIVEFRFIDDIYNAPLVLTFVKFLSRNKLQFIISYLPNGWETYRKIKKSLFDNIYFEKNVININPKHDQIKSIKVFKKITVLLVTGTGDETVKSFQIEKTGEKKHKKDRFRWRAGFIVEKKKRKEQLRQMRENAKNKHRVDFTKDPLSFHFKGVRETIKLAQAKGYEVFSTEKASDPFYVKLRREGKRRTGININKIVFYGGFTNFNPLEFYNTYLEKGEIPTIIVQCGHWRNGCVQGERNEIKIIARILGLPVSDFFVILGTPSIVSYRYRVHSKESEKEAKDHMEEELDTEKLIFITLSEFREFEKLKEDESLYNRRRKHLEAAELITHYS